MIRVIIPHPLQTLTGADAEVQLEVPFPVTVNSIIQALESRYPMLRGAILEHETGKRRPKLRFFACSQDVSLQPANQPLPKEISSGTEPFIIIGAISGG